LSRILELLASFDDDGLVAEVKAQLDAGTAPAAILADCQDAMVEIGNRFSAGELFVSDLMMAGMMFKQVSDLVLPLLTSSVGESAGKVVLGTVKNDIHDLGKDIVNMILTAAGFEVIDLGVDVAPEAFVKALKDSGAKVLALSCLLVTCYESLKETVEAVGQAGLRDSVKIIIGGGPIDETVVAFSGADAMGVAAQDGVTFCKEVYA
jgi:methanogenic corrinoid protein MtbC1